MIPITVVNALLVRLQVQTLTRPMCHAWGSVGTPRDMVVADQNRPHVTRIRAQPSCLFPNIYNSM